MPPVTVVCADNDEEAEALAKNEEDEEVDDQVDNSKDWEEEDEAIE